MIDLIELTDFYIAALIERGENLRFYCQRYALLMALIYLKTNHSRSQMIRYRLIFLVHVSLLDVLVYVRISGLFVHVGICVFVFCFFMICFF